MTTKYFSIQFNDLSFEKQQEMTDEISAHMYGVYQEETENGRYGKNFGREEYKNMTWQESFIREYSVDYILWETEEDAKKFDWNFAVKQYAEESAQKQCESCMDTNKVEITI